MRSVRVFLSSTSLDLGTARRRIAEWLSTGHTLTLTDTINCARVNSRGITHDLRLGHSITCEIDNRTVTENYTPFVGTGADATYTPPTTTVPTLGHGTLTLTHPFVSPTTTLVLRNPAFGNSDRVAFNRINRKTRGGTLVVYADPAWPKMQSLQVTVNALSSQQAADTLAFLKLSLGQEIGLLDHENRQWRGTITNPDAEVANPGRDDYSVSLEFEGALA